MPAPFSAWMLALILCFPTPALLFETALVVSRFSHLAFFHRLHSTTLGISACAQSWSRVGQVVRVSAGLNLRPPALFWGSHLQMVPTGPQLLAGLNRGGHKPGVGGLEGGSHLLSRESERGTQPLRPNAAPSWVSKRRSQLLAILDKEVCPSRLPGRDLPLPTSPHPDPADPSLRASGSMRF